MSRKITFTIPTKNGPVIEEGIVAHLFVGSRKRKFVIHGEPDSPVLTDYRTGYKVADLNPIKIEAMCLLGDAHRMTDRDAAQATIDKIVRRIGVEKFFATVNEKPTLNA